MPKLLADKVDTLDVNHPVFTPLSKVHPAPQNKATKAKMAFNLTFYLRRSRQVYGLLELPPTPTRHLVSGCVLLGQLS